MDVNWTKHITDPEEREQYQRSLVAAKWILEAQNKILDTLEQDLDRQELNPRAYDSPNWSHKQAHLNGFRQALRLVKTINNLDQKEQHDRQSIRPQ